VDGGGGRGPSLGREVRVDRVRGPLLRSWPADARSQVEASHIKHLRGPFPAALSPGPNRAPTPAAARASMLSLFLPGPDDSTHARRVSR
jgi:hypothetical protein